MTNELKEKLQILARYCAYQERCSGDVLQKMQEIGVLPEDREILLEHLKKEKFLDDLRFAKAFVNGKFKINQWGKIKIKSALIQKKLDFGTIQAALDQINPDDYKALTQKLADKQLPKIKARNEAERKQKLYFYLSQKGFESDIIRSLKL